MKLSAAVEDYAACARREVGHSRNTYLNYRLRLRQFQPWVVLEGLGDLSIKEISYPLLRRYYLTSLLDQGIKPNTIRDHVHALCWLFDYMVEQDVVDGNPHDGEGPQGEGEDPSAPGEGYPK